MISSQDFIGLLACRIERAYRRRYPKWVPVGLTPGSWEAAASRLLEASVEAQDLPVDPELFVAVQSSTGLVPDPWAELTQRISRDRYLKSLRQIVGQLRQELKAEIRRAKRFLHRGMNLDQVLTREADRISPLTRYILAVQAGRHDLSMIYRAAAERQHRSCPLYRLALRSLLPSVAYPFEDPSSESFAASAVHEYRAFSLN